MLKFMNRFTLSLILILSLASQKTSAEINLKPSPFACLDRDQREQVAIAFEENFACHQVLKQAVQAPQADWEIVLFAIAGGIVAGMVLDSQIHH